MFRWLRSLFSTKEADGQIKSSPAAALRYRMQDKNVDPRPRNIGPESYVPVVDASVATAVIRIADALNTLPKKVYSQYDYYGDTELEPADDHPLNKLFEMPMPAVCKTSWNDLTFHVIQSLVGSGNSYHAIEKADDPDSDFELWPLEPEKVKIKQDAKGLPSAYIYECNGAKIEYDPEDILHIKLYDLHTPLYGKSRMSSINPEIMTAYYAKRMNRTFYERGAQIGGLITPKEELTEKQAEDLLESWRARYGGWKNAHKTAIMPIPAEYSSTTPSMKDMQHKEMLEFDRETELGLLGVTPIFAGILRYTNYSTSVTQEKLFWTMAVLPLARLIESAINNQILDAKYGKGYIFKYDSSQVEALQPDRESLARTEQIYVLSKIRTINEIRAEHGWGEVEWGNEPTAPPPQFMPAEEEEEEGQQNSLRIIRGVSKEWKDHDNYVTQKERGFYIKLRSFFRGQEGRLIDNFNKYTGKMYHSKMKLLSLYDKKDANPELSAIFNMAEEDAILELLSKSEFRKVMRESGLRGLEAYGLAGTFNMQDPAVLVEIEKLVNRINNINQTTWANLKDLFAQATEEGMSRDDVMREIRGMFKDMSTTRARRIAQTEMNGVVNGGTWQSWSQAGVTMKKWSATLNNTRDSHLDLHGQTVRINEPWISMLGSAMLHPGDPAGLPGDTINCHCGMVPVMEE